MKKHFKDGKLALFDTSWLLILFLQEIPMIECRCHITYAWSRSTCKLYMFQASVLGIQQGREYCSTIYLTLDFGWNMLISLKSSSIFHTLH